MFGMKRAVTHAVPGSRAAVNRGARRTRLWGTTATAVVLTMCLSGCTSLFAGLFGGGAGSPFDATAPSEEFSSFDTQTITWVPCNEQVECAEVYAPLDWHDPEGERITLALVRQPATGDAEPLGTLFVNPGGPGASGVDYLLGGASHVASAAVQERYDIVSWDPRGVGASSAISCFTADELDEMYYGEPVESEFAVGSDEWIDEMIAASREYGDACVDSSGPLAEFVSTAATVADLDMLRSIVGDEQLNYLGYSYGTKLGARYADAYPERVGRLVLDGALDPTATMTEVVRAQTIGFEQALRSYVADCVSQGNCPFPGSVDEVLVQINAALRAVDDTPLVSADGRYVESSVALTAIIAALYSADSWPYITRVFTELPQGDTETTLLLADFYNDRVEGVYQSNMMEAFNVINCLDYGQEARVSNEDMRQYAAELETLAPTIGEFQGYGETFCADWPASPSPLDPKASQPTKATGAAPILVVGTTGDPATPYEWAEKMAGQLSSGVLVSYHGEGHTAYLENDCIDAVIDEYLLTGTTPVSDPHCARAV